MKDSSNIRINSEVDFTKWDQLIQQSKFATPFQEHKYYNLKHTEDHIEKHVFAIENIHHSYEALCVITIQKERGIKSFFSKRGIIFGGPVLSPNCSEIALKLLFSAIVSKLKSKVIYIETRNFHKYDRFSKVFKEMGWAYTPYLNVKVALSGEKLEDVLATFKYNRRREIKLTLKAGIVYTEAKGLEDIESVYALLIDLYKKRIGLPIPSLHYFIDFWTSGMMKIFVVKDKDLVIGGSFCIVQEKKAIYTFYYCGERAYKLKTYPTHLAVLAAIDYGLKNGLKYLDFMGAGKPDIDYGVRKYKMEFGGELVEEGRYLKITNRLLYKIGVQLIKLLKRKK